MAGSVGPLKVGVAASVGDFAGPVRDAIQGAKREVDNFNKTAKVARAGEQDAWVRAMRGQGGPLQNAGGMLGGLNRGNSNSYLRGAAVQYANQNVAYSTMSAADVAKAMSGGGGGAAGEGGGGGGRGGWAGGVSLRGLRGFVGGTAMMALRAITNPVSLAVAGGYAAYRAGSEAREAGISGSAVGMSASEYAGMSRRAYWAGTSPSNVAGGISHFEQLGASSKVGTAGMSISAAMNRIGDVMDKTKDPVEKLRLGIQLFGDQAVATMNTIQTGRQWGSKRLFWEPTGLEMLQNKWAFGEGKGIFDAAAGLGQRAVGSTIGLARWAGAGFSTGPGSDELAKELRLNATQREQMKLAPKLKAIEDAKKTTLATPYERFDFDLRQIGANRVNKWYSKDKTENDMFAGRAGALAAGQYASTIGKPGPLAGAYESSSVAGYSQMTEAAYNLSATTTAAAETNKILRELLGPNSPLLTAINKERNFQHQGPK